MFRAQVADVIVDVADDASRSEVLFMPFWDFDGIGTSIDGPTDRTTRC